MNSNDKAFLEKFSVKESSILIGLENFVAKVFSIMDRLGWHPPSIKRWPNLHPQSLLHQIFTSYPEKPYAPLMFFEIDH